MIGRRNHGKTRLVVDLVREMRRRGISVGTFKHSSHHHPVDRPGKDSWLHREAGAEPAVFSSDAGIGVFLGHDDVADPIDRVAPLFHGVEILLVEGFIDRPGPKIEVYRADAGGTPLAPEFPDVIAVVTDDDVDPGVPVWPRSDVAAAVDRLTGVQSPEE